MPQNSATVQLIDSISAGLTFVEQDSLAFEDFANLIQLSGNGIKGIELEENCVYMNTKTGAVVFLSDEWFTKLKYKELTEELESEKEIIWKKI